MGNITMLIGGPEFTEAPSENAKMLARLFGPIISKACGDDLFFTLTLVDVEDDPGTVRGPAMATNTPNAECNKGLATMTAIAATKAIEHPGECLVECQDPDEAEEEMPCA